MNKRSNFKKEKAIKNLKKYNANTEILNYNSYEELDEFKIIVVLRVLINWIENKNYNHMDINGLYRINEPSKNRHAIVTKLVNEILTSFYQINLVFNSLDKYNIHTICYAIKKLLTCVGIKYDNEIAKKCIDEEEFTINTTNDISKQNVKNYFLIKFILPHFKRVADNINNDMTISGISRMIAPCLIIGPECDLNKSDEKIFYIDFIGKCVKFVEKLILNC